MGDIKNSLKVKAACNLDNLVHQANSLFIPSIANFPLPPLKNFNKTKDLFDYLEAFKTIMQLQVVPKEIMCQAFPMGIRGSTRVWFNKLESESIGSFVQLSRAFIDHFIDGKRTKRTPSHSLTQRQANGRGIVEGICASLQQRGHANRLFKGRRHFNCIHGRIAKGKLPLRSL